MLDGWEAHSYVIIPSLLFCPIKPHKPMIEAQLVYFPWTWIPFPPNCEYRSRYKIAMVTVGIHPLNRAGIAVKTHVASKSSTLCPSRGFVPVVVVRETLVDRHRSRAIATAIKVRRLLTNSTQSIRSFFASPWCDHFVWLSQAFYLPWYILGQ